MDNFNIFIDKLSIALGESLPGRKAQFLMEPHTRKFELKMQKNRANAKQSSVLILLYPKNSMVYSVMIKRPVYDGVLSGQIAFPGGKKEDNDIDLFQTALREAEEEIGVKQRAENLNMFIK